MHTEDRGHSAHHLSVFQAESSSSSENCFRIRGGIFKFEAEGNHLGTLPVDSKRLPGLESGWRRGVCGDRYELLVCEFAEYEWETQRCCRGLTRTPASTRHLGRLEGWQRAVGAEVGQEARKRGKGAGERGVEARERARLERTRGRHSMAPHVVSPNPLRLPGQGAAVRCDTRSSSIMTVHLQKSRPRRGPGATRTPRTHSGCSGCCHPRRSHSLPVSG